MTTRDENPIPQMPPECALLVDRLQPVLDGAVPASALDADPHAASCDTCRERIAAARLLLGVLATPTVPCVPTGLTNSILTAIREDRFTRLRRQSYAVAGGIGIAIAASLLLATWLLTRGVKDDPPTGIHVDPDLARQQPPIAPEPRPVRLGDEFSRMGQALLDTPNPFAGPAAGGSGVLGKLTNSISIPAGTPQGFEPTRDALAELPDAARSGLEPVTSTTQKAFARLLRDVGGVQVSTRPKS